MGVGKYTPRRSEPAPSALVRAVVAEVLPVEPRKDANSRDFSDTATSDEDGGSTLRRLETAEKVAYERYVASGGSERAAIAWLGICDQKRKLVADQQKHANNVSESETRFMANCCAVIDNLYLHLQTAPKLLGMLCEGLDRDVIAEKIADQLRRTIKHAVTELADQLRGTSLERLLPPEERGKRVVKPEEIPD